MRNKFVFTAAAGFLALSLNAGQVLAHAEHGQPQYGGVVAEAGEVQFEIVGKAGQITVYATNHGVPVATAGASGKLTVLAGAQKTEVLLKPAGDNRLAGPGNAAAGAKLLLQVQWPDKKPLQARAVMP